MIPEDLCNVFLFRSAGVALMRSELEEETLQLRAAESRLRAAEEREAAIKADLEQEQLERVEVDGTLSSLRSKLKDTESALADSNTAASNALSELADLRPKYEQAMVDLEESQAEASTAKAEATALKSELDGLATEFDQIKVNAAVFPYKCAATLPKAIA